MLTSYSWLFQKSLYASKITTPILVLKFELLSVSKSSTQKSFSSYKLDKQIFLISKNIFFQNDKSRDVLFTFCNKMKYLKSFEKLCNHVIFLLAKNKSRKYLLQHEMVLSECFANTICCTINAIFC